MARMLRIPTLLSLGLLLACPPASAAQLDCDDLPALFAAFHASHYSVKKQTPEVRERSAAQYVKALDPSRTLLLQADADRLKASLPAAFEAIGDGTCAPIADAAKLVATRAKEDEALAKEMLKDGYKLDESVELVTDPDKRGYAKTPEERLALVKKLIHFQISSSLIAGLTLDAARKQLIHRYELISKRVQEKVANDSIEIFAEAFAEALDPHSSFMSADTLADFQIQMRLSLEGIGAALSSQDGFTVIESLIPGGSAERTNQLQPKDKILSVAQDGAQAVSVIDMDLQEVVKMIRGKKGTKVTLTILREGDKGSTFTVTIVRDKIDVKEQAAKLTIETRKVGERSVKIGVIDLPSFYGGGGGPMASNDAEGGGRSASRDVKNLLEEAKLAKVDGVVLDLSSNGGGLLSEAVLISGLFIKQGSVVATKDTVGRVEVLDDEDDAVTYSGPLTVVVSAASASASEILAGALKAYRRALIVGGEHSFGKGTVQTLSPLPRNLGAMKVTTQMFFIPSGASTQQAGVTSDVVIPSLYDAYSFAEKSLDYSLPPQSIAPFVSPNANPTGAARWKAIDEKLIPDLAARSKERVAKDPEMAEILKEVEESKSKDIVRLSEVRKKAKEQKEKEQKEEKGAKAKEPKELTAGKDSKDKSRFKELRSALTREAVNVAADLIVKS